MKIEFKGNVCAVTREKSDYKIYGQANASGESKLLYQIQQQLNKQGYNLIKKRMWKDGHLVDDCQQYLRTKKTGAGKADIYIYNPQFAQWSANEKYNEGYVELEVIYGVFKEGK